MVEPQTHLFEDDGVIPNHPTYTLLFYPREVELTGPDPAAVFETLFRENGWGGSWRNGVFSFPHYHAEAHKVLGVYSGSARIQLGVSLSLIQI